VGAPSSSSWLLPLQLSTIVEKVWKEKKNLLRWGRWEDTRSVL
jgi:hypothetical protein